MSEGPLQTAETPALESRVGKDLTEHLRLVHFTLVITCVGLVVALTLNTDDQLTRAIDEGNSVRRIQRNWERTLRQSGGDTSDSWLREKINHLASEAERSGGARPWLTEFEGNGWVRFQSLADVPLSEGRSVTVRVSARYRRWQPLDPSGREVAVETNNRSRPNHESPANGESLENLQIVLPVKPSLAELSSFWNHLAGIDRFAVCLPKTSEAILYSVQGSGLIIMDADSSSPDPSTTQPTYVQQSHLPYRSDPRGSSRYDWIYLGEKTEPFQDNQRFASTATLESIYTEQVICNRIQRRPARGSPSTTPELGRMQASTLKELAAYAIGVPIRRVEIRSDLHRQFVSLGNRDWEGLSFTEAFPDLEALTSSYQNLNIDDILKVLNGQRSQSGERFEAFGIKLPINALSQAGLLILMCIQIYFWLHLAALARRLQPQDEAWDVAWIALYDRWSARLIFLVTISFLPAACAVFLINRAWLPTTPNRNVALLACSVFTFLAIIATVLSTVRVWRLPAPR